VRARRGGTLAVLALAGLVACVEPAPTALEPEPLTVYSGRAESLIGPILEKFEAHGVSVQVRYGDTAEMTATLLEEGENTPADVFISQDAAALGALSEAGLLRPLPVSALDRVAPRFRAPDGRWIGLSGRARTVVYNPEAISPQELPQRLEEVTSPRFEGRYGVPPTNGSFQAHMAVFHAVEGAEALDWLLAGMVANGARRYANNRSIVQAVASGEIDFGFVNHYYVSRALREDSEAPLAMFYMPEGRASNFVNMAGGAVLSDRPEATDLLEYLLSEEAQRYFSGETFEYPLIESVEPATALAPLDSVPTPEVDFATVSSLLESTLEKLNGSGLVE
jgi:iron(III) transport system substrate-binding protein